MTLEAQNTTQAETIDRIRLERGELRVKVEQQAKRIDTLQGMVNFMRKEIDKLKSPERFFK